MFQRVDQHFSTIIFWQLSVWSFAFWLVWCIATTLMLLPADELPIIQLWDKAEHAITFFVLMLLAWLGYRKKIGIYWLMALLVGYGTAIECIQFFNSSRSFSVLDIVADTVGILIALFLIKLLKLI